MENQEMIQRYIYAVTQTLPAAEREDLGRELAAVIEDTLAGLGPEAAQNPAAVRQVLRDLGSPRLLAMKYRGREAEALIGQPHYNLYQIILRIVLWAAGGGLVLAQILTAVFEPQANLLSYTFESLFSIFNGLLVAFAITTLIFAVMYRKQVRFDEEDFLESLPELPAETQKRESPWELAAGIIFFVLFILAFAYSPRVNLPVLADGKWTSILNGELVGALAPLALAAGLLNLTSLIVNYAVGEVNTGAAILDLGANALGIIYAFSLLTKPEVLNPGFAAMLQGLTGLDAAGVSAGFQWLPLTVLAVIVVVLLFDSGQTIYGLIKAKSKA